MSSELFTQALSLIQQVGFPIFVACWFMFMTDKKIVAHTKAIDSLRKAIRVAYKIDNGDEDL